ncbi:hypothetical protein, partial [Enterococcus faecalis]|uniref:hypothetical protein n=1 Tax=Enterococcus faecalis TaxID=1351 RepID=UPI0022F07A6B
AVLFGNKADEFALEIRREAETEGRKEETSPTNLPLQRNTDADSNFGADRNSNRTTALICHACQD